MPKKTMTMTARDAGKVKTKKAIPEKKLPPVNPGVKRFTRQELEAMNMTQLRDVGRPWNVNDNSRVELISEILDAQNKGGGYAA